MQWSSNLWTDLQDDQIRLLHLPHASLADSGIDCQLKAATLGTSPTNFVAISYTWGDEPRNTKLVCNGIEHHVTQSCVDALKAVRILGWSSVWIDQLCVNQHDRGEISKQVQLMHRIYGRADRVFIWMGNFVLKERSGSMSDRLEHLPESELRLMMHTLVDRFSVSELPADRTRDYNGVFGLLDRILDIKSPLSDKDTSFLGGANYMCHLILNLLHRRCHLRRWIVQEVALKKNVDILLDDMCFPFEVLVRMTLILRPVFSIVDDGPERIKLSNLLGGDVIDRFWLEVIPFLSTGNIDMISRIRDCISRGKTLDFIDVFLQCTMFKVTQDVDDLYAISALLGRSVTVPAPVPDYAASLDNVYCDHTAWLISLYGLRVFSRLPLLFYNDRNMPTWSVDFSTAIDLMTGDIRGTHRLGNRHVIYWDYLSESRTPGLADDGLSYEEEDEAFNSSLPRAAADYSLVAIRAPLVAGRKLHIDTLLLDTVTDIMPYDPTFHLKAIQDAHAWYRSSSILSKRTDQVNQHVSSNAASIETLRYGSHNDNITAYREKILYNLVCNPDTPRLSPDEELIYFSDLPAKPHHRGTLTDYKPGNKYVSTSLLGEVVFGVTSDGWPVLLPYEARLGDQVAFFPGVTKPFILRKYSEDDEYRIVGQAHVLSLMWWDEPVPKLSAFEDVHRLVIV